MRLKKNNVAIDVISFANPENVEKLQALVNAANMEDSGANTCNFLDVPAGVTNITDVMISSPILQAPIDPMGDASGAAGGGGGAAFGGNIDPNVDPELAEALRISLEEAQAAEQAANGNNAEARPQPAADVQPGLQRVAEEDDGMYSDDAADDDEAALKEALALSMLPEKKDE